MNKLIALFILCSSLLFAQNGNEPVVVIGDSLIGKNDEGARKREVIGNVIITQGDVKITCNKAIQNIDENVAELIGNVIVTQDTITIKTENGFYDGNNRIAFSNIGVTLEDTHIILNAVNGYYYFNEKRAYFYNQVTLYDKINNLFSDKLTYFHNQNKAVAVGKVCISDTASTILSDSLIHFRNNKISYAYNNITIINRNNNVTIFGNYLESFPDSGYSKIIGDPFLVQIDTAKNGQIDTLYISAITLETFKDSLNTYFKAMDSVKIFRQGFISKNDYTLYYKNDEKLLTYKVEDVKQQPIMWYQDSQLTGDSIFVYLKDRKLDYIDIINDGFMISKVENYDFRYNQISGINIKLFFNDSSLTQTSVNGNVLSIYYTFEDEKPKGLIKSSGERAKLLFTNKKISDVRLYVSAISEFHPESLVFGKEKDFTLPLFQLHTDKPEKSYFINKYLSKIQNY
ncbi:MAG: OstA-like protein [bacterium]